MTQQQTTQDITPQLRQWIIDQAAAGFNPEAVLKAMVASGWTEDVALAALESTLQAHVQTLQAQPQLPQQDLPPSVPVPDLPLDGEPLYIDAGGRKVHVLTVVQNPRIVVLGGFLSDGECDALILAAKPQMKRSLTISVKTGGEETNEARTSNGMFFQRGANDIVKRIEQRIARLLAWPLENGEGLQILQYGPGAEYKPHYDYFDPKEPGTPTILRRGGQRVATVVMYLSEPERGGGTVFPDIGLQVAPKRGNAVFFSYPSAHPSTLTLHGGAPVQAGEKWIATKWLREREFI